MNSKKTKIPRGIRNNNPLNIVVGNNWVGEVSHPTDHTFEQFTEMKYGVRAAFIILRNYIKRHKLNTIEKIIQRWCPDNTAPTYIRIVSKRMLVSKDYIIDFDNVFAMIALFQAMCFVENGCEIDIDDVVKGYRLATNLED